MALAVGLEASFVQFSEHNPAKTVVLLTFTPTGAVIVPEMLPLVGPQATKERANGTSNKELNLRTGAPFETKTRSPKRRSRLLAQPFKK
jgi:hypothetical protein